MHRSIILLGTLGLGTGCGGSSGAPPNAASHSPAQAARAPAPESAYGASSDVDSAQDGNPAEAVVDDPALPDVDLPSEPPDESSADAAPSFRYTLDTKCKAPLSEFNGLYFHQFEMSAFHSFDKGSAVYWVSGTADAMHRLVSVPGSAIRVRGKLSSEGKHGHLGGYKRELYVCEVLEYEPLCKTPKGARLCKCVEDPTLCQ